MRTCAISQPALAFGIKGMGAKGTNTLDSPLWLAGDLVAQNGHTKNSTTRGEVCLQVLRLGGKVHLWEACEQTTHVWESSKTMCSRCRRGWSECRPPPWPLHFDVLLVLQNELMMKEHHRVSPRNRHVRHRGRCQSPSGAPAGP
jgi:hypothetical protein